MEQKTEPFLGFTYNNIHSSSLGIVRVSDGSRFNENLLPNAVDQVVSVPGGEGQYFFGSSYSQRQFAISFAFDSLTEKDIAQLRRVFGDKKIHPLTFDEVPYKTYQAKVTGSSMLKFLAFEEGTRGRIYKGEGELNFTCYFPYGICYKKFLNQYPQEANKREWEEASGLLLVPGDIDHLSNGQNLLSLYNPGDVEADWTFTIWFDGLGKVKPGYLSLDGDSFNKVSWKEITKKGIDAGIQINSKTHLIEGINLSRQRTGTLYNGSLLQDNFFKIPQDSHKLELGPFGKEGNYIWDGILPKANFFEPISYNYYYL